MGVPDRGAAASMAKLVEAVVVVGWDYKWGGVEG